MYNKDKCHNNTRVNLMTKKNGDTTEKNLQKQKEDDALEIRNKETNGIYYDHSTIYKKDPDPFEPVKFIEQNLMNSDRAQLHKISNPVNHPDHYNAGKIEVIDAIEDWGLDFIEGNVVKYITRAKHKGNTLGDLRKARWYLDYRIAELNDKKE